MTVKEFFELLEQANKFKALVGEQKTSVAVIIDSVFIDNVTTYDDFVKTLWFGTMDENAKLRKTASKTDYKVTFANAGLKSTVSLHVN